MRESTRRIKAHEVLDALREAGPLTCPDLAERLGCSTSTIQRRLRELGVGRWKGKKVRWRPRWLGSLAYQHEYYLVKKL